MEKVLTERLPTFFESLQDNQIGFWLGAVIGFVLIFVVRALLHKGLKKLVS